ncbi:MAG: hypothetical protein J6X94_11650 [Lachnospiraceae bacterium]|nr:hypothetical protein [Lachnospiraceae bacterium]
MDMVPDINASKKNDGSVGDLMPMGIFVICIAFVMISFANLVRLINVKASVSQVSRQYILKMETCGYLTEGDRAGLMDSLAGTGLKDISLAGTDMTEVGYGNEIKLYISGFTEEGYEIREFRTSTAKY